MSPVRIIKNTLCGGKRRVFSVQPGGTYGNHQAFNYFVKVKIHLVGPAV